MGFNKRYIRKEMILSRLKEKDTTSLLREMAIDKLFSSDALIMDIWSSRFYSNLNREERDVRKYLEEKYIYQSGNQFSYDKEYIKLKSLSEALISLLNTESWIDIYFTINKLKIKIGEDERGRYKILKKKCIESIIEHFER